MVAAVQTRHDTSLCRTQDLDRFRAVCGAETSRGYGPGPVPGRSRDWLELKSSRAGAGQRLACNTALMFTTSAVEWSDRQMLLTEVPVFSCPQKYPAIHSISEVWGTCCMVLSVSSLPVNEGRFMAIRYVSFGGDDVSVVIPCPGKPAPGIGSGSTSVHFVLPHEARDDSLHVLGFLLSCRCHHVLL
ncbi:hypothetical protein BC826DRAFT_358738 [Russula brevipes]|nr:hypothetical protein BC826DRAFT_358738 [Russula brevipes]